MPTRKRPPRRGAAAEPGRVRPAMTASAYRWPCPRCDCTRNLRGLLRDVCSTCTHVHQDPAAAQKERPHEH